MEQSSLLIFVVSLLIGVVVGMTGMGGGALMTPALIFLKVDPTIAVANDLVAAAIYKSVGAGVHWKQGSPNLRLAGWLTLGSVPCAFAGAFIIQAVGNPEAQEIFVKKAIGAALLLAAVTYAMRLALSLRSQARGGVPQLTDPPIRPVPTVAVGAVGGLLVGLTSVGSGSVIMVTLLLLYPGLQAVRLVGTDLAQAVPLVLSAAVSHVIVSGVDWSILIPLVLGGTPGTFIGARIAGRVPQALLRRGIVLLLFVTGLGLLGVNQVLALVLGVVALVIGTFVWAWFRQRHGLPAFNRSRRRTKDPSDDPPTRVEH
ncbi:MAG TPA: sulfite exporter TauE/SafE family protein [Nocardioidaceae bacterium]|nr:sulfite exporter TauE/SafE family protein [Nocardioidaceae bacterium]